MATEPADVLIIGAGASGGVVARRLAEAGFDVVCLEQGEWHDKAEYRGIHLDWELTARKQWATSPNIRGLPEDYPIVEEDSPISPLMFSGVGGSMLSVGFEQLARACTIAGYMNEVMLLVIWPWSLAMALMSVTPSPGQQAPSRPASR